MLTLSVVNRIIRGRTEEERITIRRLAQPYELARTLFARLDQEIAFEIDRCRKKRLQAKSPSDLESRIQERLAAFDELARGVGPSQVSELERSKEELRWVLLQLRERRR
jgi:hypothetical protein